MDWRILLYAGGRLLTLLMGSLGLAFDLTGENVMAARLLFGFAFIAFVLITAVRELDLAMKARPNVGFTRLSPAMTAVTTTQSGGNQTSRPAHFVRCDFVNSSNGDGEGAIAKHLHATVRLLAQDGTVLEEWSGRWMHTKNPTSYSDVWELDRIDLPPNRQAVTLDIIAKFAGRHFDDESPHHFFPWYNAMLIQANPYSTNRRFYPPGQYTIEVLLTATNRKWAPVRFSLVNGDDDNPPAITLLN